MVYGWGHLGASPAHQRTRCRCIGSTVTWPQGSSFICSKATLLSFISVWCFSFLPFLSFIVACERFVGTRITISLLSYLVVDLMVTHQTQNMHNCDSSMFCQVQRRVVRAPVRYWKTAILRDVLFMSFETHFHMNRPVQGFCCWRVSEMQMCRWGSKL